MKQIFIVNQDLKMGKGKIAVQVAHGETLYMGHAHIFKVGTEEYTNHREWLMNLMTKIVLKAPHVEIVFLKHELSALGIKFCVVLDAGLTQVPSGSLTCLCVWPLPDTSRFDRFKLL